MSNSDQVDKSLAQQELLQEIEAINNKHTLIVALANIESSVSLQATSLSESFSGTIISKLLRKMFSTRIFQLELHKDLNIKEKLFTILNNENTSKIVLYQAILQTLESLKTTPLVELKQEYERKSLFEDLVVSTLLEQNEIERFCVEIFKMESYNEFSEILKTLFNLPNKVSNFLEACPQLLKAETFFQALLEISLRQSENFKKGKSQYYLQFVNGLFINGQTKLVIDLWISGIVRSEKGEGDHQWEKDFLLNIFSNSAEVVFNYPKVVRETILSFLKPDTKTLPFDTKISVIQRLMKNIKRKQFLTNYLPRYLNDKEFNSLSASLLSDLLLKYPNLSDDKKEFEDDKEFLKQAIESSLALWSEVGFVQNASIKHLKYLTNFLRRLILKANKASLEKPEIIEFIQQGVSNRLSENLAGSLQRQCAESVWTAYIRSLDIKEAVNLIDKEGLFDKEVLDEKEEPQVEEPQKEKLKIQEIDSNNQKSQSPSNETKSTKIVSNEDSDDEEFMNINQEVEEESLLTLKKPKHIYDCLLGLRADNRERLEYSLRYVNYLIRKNLNDIEFLAEDLALTLCKINNQYDWDRFEEYRARALISLVIIIPDQVSQCLIKRFFHSECSLGEKILLIDILEKAAKELADNPEKYNPELYNEFEENKNFYFKPVTVKYYSEEEKKKQEIDKQKEEKIEQQSRRWGDTKRKHEQEKSGNLKTMNSKDIMIINSSTEKIFINRFSSLCNHFFFPLVVPLRGKKQFLMKNHILLAKVISLMKTYIQSSKNSPTFYTILTEVLDFLIAFVKVDDNNVLQEVLTCFYAMSVVMNKNVVIYHENIVQKLLLLMKLITDLGPKVDKLKIFVYEISANLQKIFELGLPSDINT